MRRNVEAHAENERGITLSTQHLLDEVNRLRRFEHAVLDILEMSVNGPWKEALLEALDQLEDARNEDTYQIE